MADLPIPFMPDMVRALLAGQKSQTRRVLTPQPDPDFISADFPMGSLVLRPAILFGGPTWRTLRKLARPGDRLYVREAIKKWLSCGHPMVKYGADDKTTFHDWPSHWVRDFAPPMFMPRALSRITLIVTEVRVQRLQDISGDDARAEGVFAIESAKHTSVARFKDLWDSINANRAGGAYRWAKNPWVAATSFSVVKGNIDEVKA